MSGYLGPKINNNGLVLELDAADTNSYTSGSTTWTDLSGNGYNGTLTANPPVFNTTNFGTFTFNGSTQYIDCGNVLASLTDLTLECFVKFGTQTTSYNGIISKTLSNADGYELRTSNYTSTTTNVEFRYKGDVASIGFGTLTNNIWYHLTATGTSGAQLVYINGIQVFSNNIATTPTANSNNLSIGKLSYSGLYTNMTLGFARIYNRVLSNSEILNNYNMTKSRFGLN